MEACTKHYYCNISCSIVKHLYRTRVFVKHECYFDCISKQRKFFSLFSQAEAWPCGRASACHANDPGSNPTQTQATRVRSPGFFYHLFYLHRSRFFGHAKMMIFRSQPTTPTPTPTPEFLRNELFNAIALK